MIKPTVGRVVWFKEGDQTLAAIIAHVHSDRVVNLMVINCVGVASSRTSVQLVQEGDEAPAHSHCTWMPYQLGQAKRCELAEAHAAAARGAPEPGEEKTIGRLADSQLAGAGSA